MRPSGIRSIRLCSGLVLFSYVTLHLLNHSLGNIGLDWMEAGLAVQRFIWQGWIGTAALYSSLLLHFCLGLFALYERRALHWTTREIAQLLLGLCVPPLLANHLAVTRIDFAAFGVNKGYAQELYSFWIASPGFGRIQLALLLVAWTHGCLGLWYWLRLREWFERARSMLLALATLVPVLALLGYLQGGRQVVALAHDPAWLAAATAPAANGTRTQSLFLADLRNSFLVFDGAAIAAIMLARLIRTLRERRDGRVRITYPDGRRQSVPLGFSVLEASLLAGIPHASACGGRARCSLCRVRVLGTPTLPSVGEQERRVLARLGLDPSSVRLACQLRPLVDVSVLPIVPPAAQVAFLHRKQRDLTVEERFVAVLFVDMRDSTRLAAARLPHDAVFVIGRFIGAVSSAVTEAGGVPNQFVGDGVLALFGLTASREMACRQALLAVHAVARNIRMLNEAIEAELDGPIRFGMGAHCGTTITGEIGFRDYVTFTALGDAPNVASRLQDLAKQVGCEAIISDDVFAAAGIVETNLPAVAVPLRGRESQVAVRMLRRAEHDLTHLLDRLAPAVSRGRAVRQ